MTVLYYLQSQAQDVKACEVGGGKKRVTERLYKRAIAWGGSKATVIKT
jgi:hypothetical protein